MGFTIKHGSASAQKTERKLKPSQLKARIAELERDGVRDIQVLNEGNDLMDLHQLKRDLNGGVRWGGG